MTPYEPYRIPAGILALVIHLLFFSLLYFGFSWQSVPLEAINVELWQAIPEPVIENAAPPIPPKVIEVSAPVESEPLTKADIVMPDKKPISKQAKVIKTKPNNLKVVEIKEIDDKPLPKIELNFKPAAPNPLVDERDANVRKQQERSAANKKVVDEYTGKIIAKIRHNIVEHSGVSKQSRTEFLVTLLPGGMVLTAKLIKTSGDVIYDDSVERAILKSQPLPLPPDAIMFSSFRELKLGFEPEK